MAVPRFRLCDLPCGARLGLIGVVATLGLGLWASAKHLKNHYAPRDGESSSVSYNDIATAYHKKLIDAPLLTALKRGHPDELAGQATPGGDSVEAMPEAERRALIEWLEMDKARIETEYGNFERGEFMPEDLIEFNCVSCHTASASGTNAAAGYPLKSFDDVRRLAYPLDLEPTPEPILTASTHAHALSLGVQSAIVIVMLCWTRFPRVLTGLLGGVIGLSLAADLGSWWLARGDETFVWVIIGAGGVFNGLTALALFAVLLDLLVPRCFCRGASEESNSG